MATVDLQAKILLKAIEVSTPVSIYLTNGIKLSGIITGFDNYVLSLELNGVEQMVYKHAISTIIPQRK